MSNSSNEHVKLILVYDKYIQFTHLIEDVMLFKCFSLLIADSRILARIM